MKHHVDLACLFIYLVRATK